MWLEAADAPGIGYRIEYIVESPSLNAISRSRPTSPGEGTKIHSVLAINAGFISAPPQLHARSIA